MALPAYDIAMDELRIALTYANSEVSYTPVAINVAKKVMAPVVTAPKAAAAKKEESADDDFDVFGDDDAEAEEEPKESRAEMLARLKKEAEERTAKKEAKQRTLVAIEVKPWDVEQDLMQLWKKITTTVVQDGLKWGENCTLADVAFGIKKIQCTFVMGVNNRYVNPCNDVYRLSDHEFNCSWLFRF